ncbi:DUF4287 domain-containing protein [Deinococcus sp.]|uniref:DUF4287 domain-containing protein n=1 Tax=Deinococcus sp. TaxID=47478 RepID=UPI003CC5A422
MSFQAYLDTVHAKTGKTPADFAGLAAQQGLSIHGEIVAWLKRDFSLGHGHATTVATVILKPDARKASLDDRVEQLFAGKKAARRPTYDALVQVISGLGADVTLQPNQTYVNVLRGARKFALVQPSSADHLDVGLKLGEVEAEERLANAGSWNAMVTHRVRVVHPDDVDAQLIAWLTRAYDQSGAKKSTAPTRPE